MSKRRKAAGDWVVEYASSSKSSCRLTKNKIKKGALRIGTYVKSDKFDGTYPLWYSYAAFEKNSKKVAQLINRCVKAKSLDVINKFLALRQADQDKIKKLVGLGDGGASDDSVQESEESKKQKKELKERNKKSWILKDKLKKCKTSLLKQIIDLNKQNSKGGPDKLINRIVDGMLYGSKPGCEQKDCVDNFLTWRDGYYYCTGKSEWGKCTWKAKTQDVEVYDWEMPSGTGHDVIDNFEFKKHERLTFKMDVVNFDKSLEKLNLLNEKNKSEKEAEEKKEKKEVEAEEKVPEGCFGGYKIAFCGSLTMKHKEFREMVKENGGTFSTSVTSSCTHLVTSEDDYENRSQKKITSAISLNIGIYEEDFIHMSIEQEKKLSPDEFVLRVGKKKKEEKKRKREYTEEGELKETETEGLEPVKKKLKYTIKGRCAVDPTCTIEQHVHVLDEGGAAIYNVNLNKTDIVTNSNSFYILQILEVDDNYEGKVLEKDEEELEYTFYLFRKWGRLGSTIGGAKLEGCGDLARAKKLFEKLYYDKSGNEWGDEFVKKPGKMFPVEIDYGTNDSTELDDLTKSSSSYDGKLKKQVKDLITLIFDTKEMVRCLKELEIDMKKMPLGNLSKKNIENGFKVLSEINNYVVKLEKLLPPTEKKEEKDGEKSNEEMKDISDELEDKNDEIRELKNNLLKLSNKFYTIIPHVFEKGKRIPYIKTIALLKEKIELVEALRDMEAATSLLKIKGGIGEHPIDSNYKKLNTDVQAIDKTDAEYKMVEDFVKNTHGKTHTSYTLELIDLFKINRDDKEKKFTEDMENIQLLWHGSRTTNFVGILSRGLLIAPPSAPVTGYMFGKGVYLADMVSKSANYCRTSPSNSTGLMMLCETALGNMYPLKHAKYMEEAPDGFDSTKGIGKYCPDDKGAVKQGKVKVPLGKGINSNVKGSSLLYNEYIVYNTDQVRIKYLLKLKFHYKNRSGWW